MKNYILSLDQGTTSSKACVYSSDGSLVAAANEAYPQHFPQPGWVEHNPKDIWNSTSRSITAAIEKANISTDQIAAIGITNQRETTLVWDKQTGDPIYNAIVWQCKRTADLCQKLRKNKQNLKLVKKTGLVLDPYFSATKIQWILDNVSGARRKALDGQLRFGNVDTFLISKLTSGEVHATDISNASRTMLMDLKSAKWDEDLLKLFKVPKSLLPEIMDSSGVLGKTKNCGVLPDGIPISGVAGDQQAALFGQLGFKKGQAKCTFGTGSFFLSNTGEKIVHSKNGLLATAAWRLHKQKPVYALEGSVFICGAAVSWLRDGLGIILRSNEIESLARSVEDSGGVEFIPALSGLGAPYWNSEARGMISGLTRGSTKAHLARATLEAMALQNVDLIEAAGKDFGKPIQNLRVDGGACENNLLMQLQADYLGTSVLRPKQLESTAMGAAFLAGLGVGLWKNLEEIQKLNPVEKEFKPDMTKQKRAARIKTWKKNIQKLS